MIWLEKSYISIKNQLLGDQSSSSLQTLKTLSKIASVPLASTFNSPAFGFGWDSFWQLATTDTTTESQAAAKWQLIHLLIDPLHQETQSQLVEWLKKRNFFTPIPQLVNLDFSGLQKVARQYLQELAEEESDFKIQAKELLIKLQPKNEALSILWKAWVDDQNEEALIQAAELGLTAAKLTYGLRLARLDIALNSEQDIRTKSNASLKRAAHWLELAAKDGDRDAWYALGEIYRRPQFSLSLIHI